MSDQIITELTGMWYGCLIDHHKDRDCHWTIDKTWSYGAPPEFRVLHYGYVNREINRKFTNYEAAGKFLIGALCNAVANETKMYLSSKDPDYTELPESTKARFMEYRKRIAEIRKVRA